MELNNKIKIKKMNKLTYPKLPNYEICETANLATEEPGELPPISTLKDKVPTNPNHKYAEVLVKNAKLNQILQNTREEAKTIKNYMKKQWDALEQEEEEFKETFCSYNKFIAANAVKRERAMEKLAEMKRFRDQKQKDMERLRADISRLKQLKRQFDSEIRKLTVYQVFLERVVIISSYRNIRGLISRFEELIEVRESLFRKRKENIEAFEMLTKKSQQYAEKKDEEILNLQTDLSEARRVYDMVSLGTRASDNLIKEIGIVCTYIDEDQTQALYSMNNLYREMKFRKKFCPKTQMNDTVEDQILFIKQSLGQLMRTTKRSSKLARLSQRLQKEKEMRKGRDKRLKLKEALTKKGKPGAKPVRRSISRHLKRKKKQQDDLWAQTMSSTTSSEDESIGTSSSTTDIEIDVSWLTSIPITGSAKMQREQFLEGPNGDVKK